MTEEMKETKFAGKQAGTTESVVEEQQPSKKAEEQVETEQDESDDLKQTIKQLESEKEEYKNQYLRSQADLENFRRRAKEEKTMAAKYKAQSLAEKLLPVLDNFERGLNIKSGVEETQSLLDGMEIVYRQLKDALDGENIREIVAEGQPFDPHFHQAIMEVEDEDYKTGTVIEVVQKGYALNDRVIRPAMVKVAA